MFNNLPAMAIVLVKDFLKPYSSFGLIILKTIGFLALTVLYPTLPMPYHSSYKFLLALALDTFSLSFN